MMLVYVYDGQSRQRLVFTKEADCLLEPDAYPSLTGDLYLKASDAKIFYQYEGKPGVLKNGTELAGLSFYMMAGRYRYYGTKGHQRLLVGSRPGSDLLVADPSVELLLEREGADWRLTLLKGTVYVNNHRVSGSLLLPYGAEIAFEDHVLKVYPDEVWAQLPSLEATSLPDLEQSAYAFYEDYPDYHRSPRLIYRSSEDKVQVNAPSAEPQKPKNEILKMLIPPIVMVGVTLLISIFQPRGLYIIMSVVSSIMTTIFSVQNYFKSKRDYKESLAQRISAYQAYLSDKSIQLTGLATKQGQGQLYHYPGPDEVADLAASYSHRIYEKRPQEFDFLHYRLGLGEVATSYQLTYSQAERSGVKDPLEVEGYNLYAKNRILKDLPIVANLMHGPVGYVGDRELVLEQLQLMVQQLALFHSYHEVQFVTILPEEERGIWHWMRWLPHATLQGTNVRGFVYNQRSRDQVLNSLNQILKQRQTESREPGRQDLLFSPHYVVLVTDKTLIMDHVIMEFFNEDPTALGCSLVFVEDVMSSLSENIQTVITLKDRQTGTLLMEEGILRETDFSLDHFPQGYDKETLSRQLAPLNHLQNLKSSIPEAVTFMELYGATEVADLNITERWAEHAPYKSLAVPLGLRGQDDIVQLNLHEKAHGPHGLVAGTTGSGKSEILQSYILSLAVNFHPHDVAFLLIDYKGGGMANLFRDLPHLLGTITNLDGAQSMRALTSIKAELKRRQQLFSRYDVNHINQYQKKVKLGEAKEPMPHLFLISDEFAELKQNQPDFMAELVSTARIGRSLGIHLILATQKPSGVVNDQIWSNSRFKLALKVADRADSQEMLKTPDAADITQAGRAYLQVGNNEVYELFQSAWSGADYQPEKDKQGIEDHTIYAINDLGQYEILNQDLSGLEETEDVRQVPTELDAVVTYLHDLVQEQGIQALPQPWLPPLGEVLCVQEVEHRDVQDLWQEANRLRAFVGLIDMPSQQKQVVGTYDIPRDGNLAIFGGPGMGKSSLLQALTMDFARHNKPDAFHAYLFDFGTNSLFPLRRLPHVADYITAEQEEKIEKFMALMKTEMAKRKKLFSQYDVNSKAMYEEMTGKTLPQIVLVIDNYEGHKEIQTATLRTELDNFFLTLSRDGFNLGISLIATGNRTIAIRGAVLTNFRSRIVLKLTDDSDVRNIMGARPAYTMEEVKGRGVMRYGDGIEVVQTYLSHPGQDDVDRLHHLQAEIAEMAASWTGHRPKAIPIMPESLPFEAFKRMDTVQEASSQGKLTLGITFSDVEAYSLSLSRFKHLLYTSDRVTNLQNITKHLVRAASLVQPERLILVDSGDTYSDDSAYSTDYYGASADVKTLYNDLITEMTTRLESGQTEHEPWLVIISDLETFANRTQVTAIDFIMLLEHGPKVGLYCFFGGLSTYMMFGGGDLGKALRNYVQYFLLSMRMADQSILPKKVYNSKEPYPEPDVVYLHDRKTEHLLKISDLEEEED